MVVPAIDVEVLPDTRSFNPHPASPPDAARRQIETSAPLALSGKRKIPAWWALRNGKTRQDAS
jgi:hypothetical protein